MDLVKFDFLNALPSFICSCVLCGGACPPATSGKNLAGLCLGCHGDLPWIESACRSCGLPLPESADQLHCGECLENLPPFQQTIAPFYYSAPIRQWITGFKHRGHLLSGHLLGHLLLETLRDHYVDRPLPEVILPIPLHWRRLLWRGYNQSTELAKQLARGLEIPCRDDLLKRRRSTSSQQGLSREERLRNLKNAFQVNPNNPFTRVALLDDVVTTGSTAREISHLLQQNGAKEIHLWAIARTPVDKSRA